MVLSFESITSDQKSLLVYAIEEFRLDKGWSFTRLLDEMSRCAEFSLDKDPKQYGAHHRYKWRNHVSVDQLRKIASGARPIRFPYDIVIRDYLLHVGRLSEAALNDAGVAVPRGRVTVHEIRDLWRQSNFNFDTPVLLLRCRIRLTEGNLSRLWMAKAPNGHVEFELIQEAVHRSRAEARSVFRLKWERAKRSRKSITIGIANLDGKDRAVLAGVERRSDCNVPVVWVANLLPGGGIKIERLKSSLPINIMYPIESHHKLTSSEKLHILNIKRSKYLRGDRNVFPYQSYFDKAHSGFLERNLRLNEKLIKSALIDDTIGIFTALFDGADINFQDECGETVLHICARRRNLEALRIFYGTLSEGDAEVAITAVSKLTGSDIDSVKERIDEEISGIDFRLRNSQQLLPSEVFPVPSHIKGYFDKASHIDIENLLVCYSNMVSCEDNVLSREEKNILPRRISLERIDLA